MKMKKKGMIKIKNVMMEIKRQWVRKKKKKTLQSPKNLRRT